MRNGNKMYIYRADPLLVILVKLNITQSCQMYINIQNKLNVCTHKCEINSNPSYIVELRAVEQCTKTNSRSSPRENKDGRIKSTKGNIFMQYTYMYMFIDFFCI